MKEDFTIELDGVIDSEKDGAHRVRKRLEGTPLPQKKNRGVWTTRNGILIVE